MAVQAVVVGVLLVIVFVTFLQPESESPLEGVEGQPGQSPNQTFPAPDYHVDTGTNEPGGGPGGQGGPGGPGGGPGPGQGGGSQAEGPSGTEGLGLTGPPESAGPTGPGTPSDDQYKDSLSKLASRLE